MTKNTRWVFNLHDGSLGVPRNLADGIQARVFLGENIMLSVVRFEPNSIGKMHSHSEEQWGVLLEGECVRLQGDEEIAVKAGDFWSTPGKTPHAIHAGETGALILDIFSPPRPEYKKAGTGFGATRKEE